MNTKKIVLSFVITITILWASHVWFGGLFPNNVYYSDSVLLFYPPLVFLGFTVYFWKYRKNKNIAMGILMGGIIYCLLLGFMITWATLEMGCGRFFFNLFTTCVGIK